MFSLLKYFRNKTFKVNDVSVNKTVTSSVSGNHIQYTAVSGGFILSFEYDEYVHRVNKIGHCQVLLNSVVIHQEPHNLTLSELKPDQYVKNCLSRLIYHVNQLESSKVFNILNVFQHVIFNYTKSLEIRKIRKYPDIIVYFVELKQLDQKPDTSWINRDDAMSLKFIDFLGTPFQQITDNQKLSHKFTDSGKAIFDNIRVYNHAEKYVDYSFEEGLQKVYYNDDENAGLFYTVFTSTKTNITIHLFWQVNYTSNSVHLQAFIYEHNQIIETYVEPLKVKFIDGDIDVEYYTNYLEIFVEKLLLIYFPTQNLAEFLVIPDFTGRLTDEQYNVFAMYNI